MWQNSHCYDIFPTWKLNSTAPDESADQTSQSRLLNQTWPPPVSNPPVDASTCIIASCLRLAANFLLQSASFFESKNTSMADLNSQIPPPLLQPPNLPLIVNPLFGGSLPPIPPLGTPSAASFPGISLLCSTPSFISPQPSSTSASSIGNPATTSPT